MLQQDKRCVADVYAGRPCGHEVVDGAPFSLCLAHVAAVGLFYHDLTHRPPTDLPEILQARRRELEERERLQTLAEEDRLRWYPGIDDPNAVVYYLLWQGGKIKIGTTTNLAQRLAGYPKGSYVRVLATEMGGKAVERRRHEQFATYRCDGEFFDAAPELMEHITRVVDSADIESGMFYYTT